MVTLDIWYKNSIIYCIDVDSFYDSNGDGIGDFAGLTRRLDYLAGLGVTCIWLLPFYPTQDRDNGYDVTDYYNVDPRLGTLGEFVEFTHEVNQHGMRVIVDLVVNHTSDQHPWFQQARSSPDSPMRNYYVWSKEKPADAHKGVVFPGVQESTWTYDQQAKAYYFHRFYKHQPDLNIANEEVRSEICRIMGFWLQLGVNGFRVDAAPFLIELKGIENANVTEPYEYLYEFRNFLSWRRADAILLAEANVSADKIPEYYGDGERIHMLFNFIANQRLFQALAEQRAAPLVEGLQELPQIPDICQWASFLRNHDELDLGRLSDEERQTVFDAFAPEENMQLYHRGIRRRLAPMLHNDRRRIALANSLMHTLPGTPVIWYGEEIGMGDNLDLKERASVRTPMQWSPRPNGGFSSADPKEFVRPPIVQGEYGFERVNVSSQRRDPTSIYSITERMIRSRKEHPELGWGDWSIVPADDPGILAIRREWLGEIVLAIHNLAGQSCTTTVHLNDEDAACERIDLLCDRDYEDLGEGPRRFQLDGYGYRWIRIGESAI